MSTTYSYAIFFYNKLANDMYAVKNQMRTNLSYIIILISYYLERNVTMFKHSWEWELDILRMDQKHLAVLF